MMRLIPFISFVLVAVVSLGVEAGQVRSISDRVYSDAQASRGQDIYKSQCAECHGNATEGGSGPPLVGDEVLANWSARPLTNLVDKIQKTMPFTSPGSLSRLNPSISLRIFSGAENFLPDKQNSMRPHWLRLRFRPRAS